MTVEEARNALWTHVSHVLLDMDGTLLDKYFDDYFWGHLVPEKYAEKHKITFGRAKDELFSRYSSHEGTLNWTDIDFWSKELRLDIPALKEQIKHLIEVHPFVEVFLDALQRNNKTIILTTNAHYKTISLKMKKTELGRYFDRVITSFDMGCPKENLEFWQRAEKLLGFGKNNTLFVDDLEDVLKTATDFGIKYVLLKKRASSKETTDTNNKFPSIKSFEELL